MVEVVDAATDTGGGVRLAGLREGSAVAVVEHRDHDGIEILDEIRSVFESPSTLTRELRAALIASRTRWADTGIRGLSFESDGGDRVIFDDALQARLIRSLERPRQWLELRGELRRFGETRRGTLTGKVLDERTGRIINFDAPAAARGQLTELLFQRVSLSGLADVDDRDVPSRLSAEVVEPIPEVTRLTDFDNTDIHFDIEAGLRRLTDLRHG